jgi:hypothetical protein
LTVYYRLGENLPSAVRRVLATVSNSRE